MKSNEQSLDEIKEELANLKNSLKTILADSKGVLSDKAKTLMEETLHKFEENLDSLKDKTKKTYKDIDETVREHPWQVAGAALAVGLIVGLLISRSRD